MRFILLLCALLNFSKVWAGQLDELQYTYRTVQKGLVQVSALEDHRAALLHADYKELQEAAGVTDVKLLVTPDLLAQAFPTRVIAVGLEVAQLPRSQRLFVLAHELAHVVNNDFESFFTWAREADQTFALVSPDLKDQASEHVNDKLQKLSHQLEFAADKYAYHMLNRIGLDPLAGAQALLIYGPRPESVVHPATEARFLNIKSLSF